MSRIRSILEEIQNPKILKEGDTKFVDKINSLATNFGIVLRDINDIQKKVDDMQQFIKRDSIDAFSAGKPDMKFKLNLDLIETYYFNNIRDQIDSNAKTISEDPKISAYILKSINSSDLSNRYKGYVAKILDKL